LIIHEHNKCEKFFLRNPVGVKKFPVTF